MTESADFFIHHPDGYILINKTGVGREFFSSSEFERVSEGYALPARAVGRSYEPGNGGHIVIYPNDVYVYQGESWAKGNQYIANLAQYSGAIQEERTALATTASEAKNLCNLLTAITDNAIDTSSDSELRAIVKLLKDYLLKIAEKNNL